jgi:hypothetical protein
MRLMFSAILCLLMFAGSLPAADSRSRSSESYREQYGVVSERNIFLRSRYRPPSTRPSYTSSATQRVPEQSFVLRGVVLEDGEQRAYFEDGQRATLKLRTGDAIARGKIAEIDVNAVLYEAPGQQVWVVVGSDLTSQPLMPGASPASIAAAGAATQPSSASSIDPNDPNLSLEERMKLRRMKELNR